MTKKLYKVDTKINGELNTRLVCSTRTKAQKYILSKYNAYSKDKRFYIRFTHYLEWGKYKKPYNDMCIDLMHVETKSLNICIELTPV
jgi:hypothetical protein